MGESASSIDRIVEILVDLDVVAFDEPGPWPGPPGADDQVCDVDIDAVWPSPQGSAVSDDRGGVEAWDPWVEVGTRVREIASRGPYEPPPILDALAWYLPIHFFGSESAIYIRETALLQVAGLILQRLPEERRDDRAVVQGACRSAYTVLFFHEAFHHKAESFAIRIEVAERTRRYVPYTRQVSKPLLKQGSDEVLEEALACAEMLNRLTEPAYTRGVPRDVRKATKDFVRWFIPTLGPSYRRGCEFFGSAFPAGLRSLQGQIQEAAVVPHRDPGHWEAAPNLHRGIFSVKTMTRVIVPVGSEPLIPWFTPSFRGTISSRKAQSVLTKRFGYSVGPKRGKGSHIWFDSPTWPSVSLPANRESLSPGVVRTIAKGVGLKPQELIDLARRA